MATLWLHLMLIMASVQQVTSTVKGRHSLWIFANCISGPTQFPECSAVMMLDDLQVGYCDSTLDHVVSAKDRTPLNVHQKAMGVVIEVYHVLKYRLAFAKQHFNLTKGVHVQQRISGCEILDGQPTISMTRDSFDGEESASRMFNTTHFSYYVRYGWASQWGAAKWNNVRSLYHYVFCPTCVAVLTQLLEQNKNLVTRRVRPRFRMFSKKVEGGALLTCLATDFYPRHINLTLLRDGRQVEEDQLISSPVLPNGNDLYQQRKTLVVTEEELQQKHNYTCIAAHLSLDNRLEVSWKAESYHSQLSYLVLPLVVTLVLLAVVLVAAVRWNSRNRGAYRAPKSNIKETEEAETKQPPEGAS